MQTDRETLERLADSIEAGYRGNGVTVQVNGGTMTHRLIMFDLITAAKLRDLQSHVDQISVALGGKTVRVYKQGGRFCLEIPLDRSRLHRLPALLSALSNVNPMAAVLGVQRGDRPLTMAMNGGHTFISGATGSGKTALARALAASLVYLNPDVKIVAVDPNRRGYAPLAEIKNIHFFENADYAWGWTLARHEKVFVFVDELADIKNNIPDEVCSNTTLVTCSKNVSLIESRGYYMHIAGLQPKTKSAPNAEKLLGRGDFLVLGNGVNIRFQGAWLGAKELTEIASKTHAR